MSSVEEYDIMVDQLGTDDANAIADYVGAVGDDIYKAVMEKLKAVNRG